MNKDQNMYGIRKGMLCCIILMSAQVAVSQAPRALIQSSANRSGILIGEHINFTVTAYADNSLGFIRWFWFPDSTRHFEIVRREKIDTQRTAGRTTFSQTLIITSFDSGSWYIPSFPVDIIAGSMKRRMYSDSILVHVGYSPADSSGQLRDIKPVMEVSLADNYLPYLIIALLLLLALILLYRYIKKRKARPKPILHSPLSAYDEAIKSLDELAHADLSAADKLKDFYSQLAYIFKRYYSRTRQRMMLNKTTGEVLVDLKEDQVTTELITRLSRALRAADAVKFARYFPQDPESRERLQDIRDSIRQMHTGTDKK